MRSPSPYPGFSVSHTRANTFARCERLYGYQHYFSWGGWSPAAPDDARTAYALKQLVSVPMLVGTIIHDWALECVARVVAGLPLPSADEMTHGARQRFKAVYTVSKRRRGPQFMADPTAAPMLQEVHYDGALAYERVEKARRTLESCLTNLHGSDLWPTIRAADPRDVIVVPAGTFPSFRVDGIQVFALPDIVYRPDADAAWHIRDWKTGAERNDGVVDQLALQALHVRHHLGLPAAGGYYQGEVAHLRHGTVDPITLTEDDLIDARAAVHRTAARMRELLVDPAANAPLPLPAFRQTEDPRRCGNCNFRRLCRRDETGVAQEGHGDGTGGAAGE